MLSAMVISPIGECDAALAGEMTTLTAPTSTSPPATCIGKKLALDLKHFTQPTIGGNTEAVVTVDENSTLLAVVFAKSNRTAL